MYISGSGEIFHVFLCRFSGQHRQETSKKKTKKKTLRAGHVNQMLNIQLQYVLTLCLYCSLHEEFNLATLDASHNKIKKLVPLSLPDSLEYVMLHENSISSIAPNTFINKLNLSRVELTSNHLQRLDLASLAISYNASNSGKK